MESVGDAGVGNASKCSLVGFFDVSQFVNITLSRALSMEWSLPSGLICYHLFTEPLPNKRSRWFCVRLR